MEALIYLNMFLLIVSLRRIIISYRNLLSTRGFCHIRMLDRLQGHPRPSATIRSGPRIQSLPGNHLDILLV